MGAGYVIIICLSFIITVFLYYVYKGYRADNDKVREGKKRGTFFATVFIIALIVLLNSDYARNLIIGIMNQGVSVPENWLFIEVGAKVGVAIGLIAGLYYFFRYMFKKSGSALPYMSASMYARARL